MIFAYASSRHTTDLYGAGVQRTVSAQGLPATTPASLAAICSLSHANTQPAHAVTHALGAAQQIG